MPAIACGRRKGTDTPGFIGAASEELPRYISVGDSVILAAGAWAQNAPNGTSTIRLLPLKRCLPSCSVCIGCGLGEVRD